MAEVGCWPWISEASHGLSLISHRGSVSWVWIGGLGSVDGGFETMDLLIGRVSNRLGFKSAAWADGFLAWVTVVFVVFYFFFAVTGA